MKATLSCLQSASPVSCRRGITAVWLVLSAPLLVALLGFVLNIGFLWLAEAEVKNAAASGALAGAQVWGSKEDKPRYRQAAVEAGGQFAEANSVAADRTHPKNHKKRSGLNAKQVVLGELKETTFIVGVKNPSRRACLVEVIVKVEGPFGWLTGPKIIRATAVAVFDEDSDSARLAHVTEVRKAHSVGH